MADQRAPEADPMEPVPGAPSDNTTAVAEIDDLRAQGYEADYVVGEGGVVRCTACRHEMQTGEVDVDVFRRLEGASEPDEMSAIPALPCLECGPQDHVMVGYGPSAPPAPCDLPLPAAP